MTRPWRSPRRWLAVVCLLVALVAPIAGGAQTVRVQSGEHADFTRLALSIGANRDWRLEQAPDGRRLRLVLDPPVDGFAIGRVFDMIPRTRLAGLSVEDGLILTLACRCDVAASRYDGRYLLLDIRDGDPGALDAAPPSAPPSPIMALPDTARLLQAPEMFDGLALSAPRGVPFRPDRQPPAGPVAGLPETPAEIRADTPTETAVETDADGLIDLEAAGRLMAEQLARAAAAGLLQADAGRPMNDGDPVVPPPPQQPEQAAPAPPSVPPTPALPIRAETAFDRVMPQILSLGAPTGGLGCTGATLDVPAWPAGDSLSDGLGGLRMALFDERDQLQRTAVIALARHYLSFGFGAEAAFWLDQIAAPPAMLQSIAALVDERPGPHFQPEADPLRCSDEELLWRYLDDAIDTALLTGEEAGRLQRATAMLPDTLRDQIAPRIARSLHADGFHNAARNLRDLLWRSGRMPMGALLRLDRDLGLAQSDPAAMRQALTLALRDAGGAAVPAMAHLLAFDREEGLPPASERLAAAEALLRENGIRPATVPLLQELVLAHMAAGAFERVLDLLGRSDLPAVDRDAVLTMLIGERLAARDTAALFVIARTFGPAWQAEGSQAGRARVGAIAHLRAAGLAGAAEALGVGQPPLILPPFDRPLPSPDAALGVAWREGNWARLAAEATGPHRDIAARMRLAAQTAAPDPLMLAADLPRLAAEIDDSRALRAAVDALLAAPRPQSAGREP